MESAEDTVSCAFSYRREAADVYGDNLIALENVILSLLLRSRPGGDACGAISNGYLLIIRNSLTSEMQLHLEPGFCGRCKEPLQVSTPSNRHRVRKRMDRHVSR